MLGAGLGGLLIIPALIVLFFYAHGSLRQMYYCIVEHNTLPGDSSLRRNLHRLVSSPASLACSACFGFAQGLWGSGGPWLRSALRQFPSRCCPT